MFVYPWPTFTFTQTTINANLSKCFHCVMWHKNNLTRQTFVQWASIFHRFILYFLWRANRESTWLHAPAAISLPPVSEEVHDANAALHSPNSHSWKAEFMVACIRTSNGVINLQMCVEPNIWIGFTVSFIGRDTWIMILKHARSAALWWEVYLPQREKV